MFRLLMWKRWNKKMAESLKGIKIKFKNWFEQWKKMLDRFIELNGEYFEGDWSLNVWINMKIFINKFQDVFGSPF